MFFFFLDNRPSPKDNEQRHPTTESIRDPFTLLPTQSKGQHHQLSSSTTSSDKNMQAYVQQQNLSNVYSSQFTSRPSRTTGSITQGSPILSSSSSLHLLTNQQQYSLATNQLLHPSYSYPTSKSNKFNFDDLLKRMDYGNFNSFPTRSFSIDHII